MKSAIAGLVGLTAALVTSSSPAAEPTKEECVAANECAGPPQSRQAARGTQAPNVLPLCELPGRCSSGLC